jgi:hypothetical protein
MPSPKEWFMMLGFDDLVVFSHSRGVLSPNRVYHNHPWNKRDERVENAYAESVQDFISEICKLVRLSN